MRTSTPRVASALAVTALVAASILVTAPAAQAHNYLVESNPAADSVITEVPDAFSVTTNEALLDLSGTGSGFAIQVTDAAGLYYGDGCGVVDGGTYSSGATLGKAGTYRFLWQVISEDGHTVSEEFSFTFEPSADAVISPGSTTAPVCGETIVEPTAEPTEEATATPENPTATESAAPVTGTADNAAADPLPWVVGGVIGLLAVVAVIAFALVGRRQPPTGESDGETPNSNPDDGTEH
ncbi:MAG: copper resistance CopC family protein [Rhodoglobus sp.]